MPFKSINALEKTFKWPVQTIESQETRNWYKEDDKTLKINFDNTLFGIYELFPGRLRSVSQTIVCLSGLLNNHEKIMIFNKRSPLW